MRKLSYWVCHMMTDSPCYSFRALTRRECIAFLAGEDAPDEVEFRLRNYSRPRRITLEYRNAFELVCALSGESGNAVEDLDRYEAKEEK